jgi:hypothetical protein
VKSRQLAGLSNMICDSEIAPIYFIIQHQNN